MSSASGCNRATRSPMGRSFFVVCATTLTRNWPRFRAARPRSGLINHVRSFRHRRKRVPKQIGAELVEAEIAAAMPRSRKDPPRQFAPCSRQKESVSQDARLRTVSAGKSSSANGDIESQIDSLHQKSGFSADGTPPVDPKKCGFSAQTDSGQSPISRR